MDKAGFLIDGEHYPPPGIYTLTMDELEVMYDYSGLTQEDFSIQKDETPEEAEERQQEYVRRPGFKKTLLHIAYQRGNPEMKRSQVAKIIGGLNFLEVAADLLEEDAEDPTATSPTQPNGPSSSETGSPRPNGGDDSENNTTGPDTPPETTGTGGSVTSPTLVPIRQVG